MAYIGKTPITGNFVKLDAISVVNGQAGYTMNNGGSAFTDYENVNQFLVSLNGILQAPTTSFTVSGSTLTFASNLATGDVIDFVIVLGNTLDIGTPSDNTVSLAKLTATGTKDATTFLRGDNTFAAVSSDYVKIAEVNTETDATNVDITLDVGVPSDNTVSLAKLTATGTKNATTFLRGDNTFAEAGGGITEADQWRITTNVNSNSNADLSSNWERADVSGATYIGTGLSQSSGIFTFPSTGKYFITFTMNLNVPASEANAEILLKTTTDNSTYTTVAMASCGNNGSDEVKQQINGHFIFDVTNTSNDKFKLATDSFGSGGTVVRGSTNDNRSSVVVIRLGDT